MMRKSLMLLVLLSSITPALAEESLDSSADSRNTPAVDDTHPTYSTDTHWTGYLLTGIAGLFLAAAVIGPIVRAEAPQAVPPAMSHEEDPAADRH